MAQAAPEFSTTRLAEIHPLNAFRDPLDVTFLRVCYAVLPYAVASRVARRLFIRLGC